VAKKSGGKGWVMTPARAAYYAGKKKKGGGKASKTALFKASFSKTYKAARKAGFSKRGSVMAGFEEGAKVSTNVAMRKVRKFAKATGDRRFIGITSRAAQSGLGGMKDVKSVARSNAYRKKTYRYIGVRGGIPTYVKRKKK
jgi:hypothetical protein